MKKVLATVVAVGSFAVAGTALAGLGAGTGVNGSLHDMNVIVGNQTDSMGRVCAFCHTPHHATTKDGAQQLPLWNHNTNAADQYVPYTWATPLNHGDANEFDIVDPVKGPSRLCMSCHDGSIAVDEHGSAFAQAGSQTIATVNTGSQDGAGRANLTKDLSTTHPIGFDYVAIATYRNNRATNGSGAGNADGTEVVWPSNGYATDVTYSDTQGTYNTVTRNTGGKVIADNLYGGTIMTCATCHEVHNKENATQVNYADGPKNVTLKSGTVSVPAPNYFLYAKEDKSLICLSCHIK